MRTFSDKTASRNILMKLELEYEKLSFRRQFLLCRNPITLFADWDYLQIGQYYLYAHPNLEVNQVKDLEKSPVIIRSIFDSTSPEKGNFDIIKDIFKGINNLENIYSRIKHSAGI